MLGWQFNCCNVVIGLLIGGKQSRARAVNELYLHVGPAHLGAWPLGARGVLGGKDHTLLGLGGLGHTDTQ